MHSAFDRILSGDIDDPGAFIESEVALWHRGDSGFAALDVYLGMTHDEYLLWVETNDIEAVVKMHRALYDSDSDNSYEEELKKNIAELTIERDRWIMRNAELEHRLAEIRRVAK